MSFIDPQFRPQSYWDPAEPLTAILGNIKGENRRQMARDFITGSAAKVLGEIDSDLLADTVGDAVRRQLGRLHPSWMGGEYLPDYLPGEVEIARIVLASTTQDVISIRARRRRGGTRILYRIVDEYHDSPSSRWSCRPRSAARPITLGQMVQLIDRAGHEDLNPDGQSLTDNLRELQEGCDPGDLLTFVTVDSEWYPELSAYYRERAKRWVYAKRQELDADGEEQDAED